MRLKHSKSSDDFYTCPLCFVRSLPYPRATIVMGHQSWYVEDCFNCVSVEELREQNAYGLVTTNDNGNT